MRRMHLSSVVAAFLTLTILLLSPAFCETVLRQLPAAGDPETKAPLTIITESEEGTEFPSGTARIVADLSSIPRGATVYRASLRAQREAITGRDDRALVPVDIRPYRPHPQKENTTIAPQQSAELLAPWYDAVDVTDEVRNQVKDGGEVIWLVKSFPGWQPETTVLEVVYEGDAGDLPQQPKGLRALHRAGQTFLTWTEVDDPLDGEPLIWGNVRKALEEDGTEYILLRHSEPITAENVVKAVELVRVGSFSGCNIIGRSVEELTARIRRRAMDDIGLSRRLARRGLKYTPDSPEMDELPIHRFAIEDGTSLPAGTGLYVHHPTKAAEAFYAVVAMRNGVANLKDFSPANALAEAVKETPGPGQPVLQPPADVTVFYDYPGQRRQYVQWTAPPLSNLPNRYYNWSVYIPRDPPKPAPMRIAFTTEAFIKPGVEHRPDTILISGQDAPFPTFWYGYHEAIGTWKSFRQGRVEPYTKRRLMAFVDWAMEEFQGDRSRLSAVGGSDALYYGVKHGDAFACVLTHQPDPDPKQTPAEIKIQNYVRRPPRPQREAIWGKVTWDIPGPDGNPIWEEFNLIRDIRENPKRDIAFLSMGPAMLSAPWPRQVAFMETLWEMKQPFCATFYWGGGKPLSIPDGRVGDKDTFDFALDLPMLALRNNSNDRALDSEQWTEKKAAYGFGGRIADGRRWLTADAVDEPGRFEITIHGQGRVTYAGGGTSDVTPRRTKKFKPSPGETFQWQNVDLKTGKELQSGEVTADANGLVTIPQVKFGKPSRLKIFKAVDDDQENAK